MQDPQQRQRLDLQEENDDQEEPSISNAFFDHETTTGNDDLATPLLAVVDASDAHETATANAPLSMEQPTRQWPRFVSVDFLRGFTMAVMILVDDAGSAFHHALDHSPWNGIRLADFVMPFFLFLVGVSIRLAIRLPTLSAAAIPTANNTSTIIPRILKRSLKLVALGMLLQGGNTTFPTTYNLAKLRIPGILQRIALAYLVAALSQVSYLTHSQHSSAQLQLWQQQPQQSTLSSISSSWTVIWRQVLLPLLPIWGIYLLLTYLTPLTRSNDTTDCPHGADLSIPCNAARIIDERILGANHLYATPTYARSTDCSSCSPGTCSLPDNVCPQWCSWPYDPEGILPSLSAVASTLFGLPCGAWLKQLQPLQHVPLTATPTRQHRILLHSIWFAYAIILVVLGTILPMPWNKNLYTITYALFMAGWSALSLHVCHVIMDGDNSDVTHSHVSWRRAALWMGVPTYLLQCMGKNAILVFVLAASGVMERLLQSVYYGHPENNVVDYFRERVLRHWLGQDPGLVVFVLIKIMVWMGVCVVLDRRKIYWTI